METNSAIKDIIKTQKEALRQLEAAYLEIENSDTVTENNELKSALEQLRLDYEKTKHSVTTLTEENAGLRNALYEQIYNEKIKIINTTIQKLNIYFKSSIDGKQNRLTLLENNIKLKIDHFAQILNQNTIDSTDEIYSKLDEVSLLLNEKVAKAQAKLAYSKTAFSETMKTQFEDLKNEQLTQDQIREVAKKNNFERFIGLNLVNAVGIFLIIIGVITAARYTYLQLSDAWKGMLMFLFGGAMMVAGELMNRKKAYIFSLGITAGGIGILYVAIASSYFSFKILDMYTALAICITITTIAFILSKRYNSQVITTFALIGGYLPMFSTHSSINIIYTAMLYFLILNIFALIMSFSKKWHVATYIGLLLNTIGTLYICSQFNYHSMSIEKTIVILYVLSTFLTYTFIPIISTYRTQS